MTGCIAINNSEWRACLLARVGGVKPPIPPLSLEQTRATIEQLLQVVSTQQPAPSRWCLRTILAACSDLLAVQTLRGLLTILRRLGITRQRARGYVHSPDGAYQAKLKAIQALLAECDNQHKVVVFADELTYYNQPSVATDYALAKQQPKARQALGSTKSWRIMGCLNPFDGRLTSIQRSKISVAAQIDRAAGAVIPATAFGLPPGPNHLRGYGQLAYALSS